MPCINCLNENRGLKDSASYVCGGECESAVHVSVRYMAELYIVNLLGGGVQ